MADWNCNLCKEYQSGVACTYCDNGSKFVRMSNADRFRAMNDEELAELFTIWSCEDADYTTLLDIKDCKWGTKKEMISRNLKWLQSEAE